VSTRKKDKQSKYRKVGAELSPKKREQLLAYMNRGFAKFGVGSTTTVQDADRPYHVMSETDLEHQLRGAQAIEDQVNATASAAAIRDRQRQVVHHRQREQREMR
jgi:hypothetical protein